MSEVKKLNLSTNKILAQFSNKIGHIIFNNPERHNAVSLEMWDAVEEALIAFSKDENIRVVVLSGSGGNSFVSGADISKFGSERGSKDAVNHYNARIKVVYNLIESFAKPTIAMINGYCIGGGLNLASCTDFRIVSEKSQFAMPAAKLALGYPFEAVNRLINAVGVAEAKLLMFTAKRIDAETALRLGFVQEVVAEDTLEKRVMEIAEIIVKNAPLTVAAMKYISMQAMKADPGSRDLKTCDAMVAACFASNDYEEGRNAFMEKRKPNFIGK